MPSFAVAAVDLVTRRIAFTRKCVAERDGEEDVALGSHKPITTIDLLRMKESCLRALDACPSTEAIKLITYQRAFQASSRVIATASEMLELLVAL